MLQKKQLQKQKEVVAAVIELNKLQKLSWNAPLVPLEKPIQTGWLRTFKLRDDCSRRNDAAAYKTICKEIARSCFCRKQTFLDKKGDEVKPTLRIIGEGEWDKLGWPEYYKKYFAFGNWSIYKYGLKQTVKGWKFWREYYFVDDDITPYFITHQRVKMPDVETRIAELNRFIEQNNGWKTYGHYKKGSYWGHDREDLRDKLLNEFDKEQIDLVGEEE